MDDLTHKTKTLLHIAVEKAADDLAALTGKKMILEFRAYVADGRDRGLLCEVDADTAEYLDAPIASRKAPEAPKPSATLDALAETAVTSLQLVEEYAPAEVSNVVPLHKTDPELERQMLADVRDMQAWEKGNRIDALRTAGLDETRDAS